MNYIQIFTSKTIHDGCIESPELFANLNAVEQTLKRYEDRCIKAYVHIDTRVPFSYGDIYVTIECENATFKTELEVKMKSLGCK